MATLPDISSLGPRPVPDAARPMAQISQGAVTAVGDAAARLGNTAATIGFEILDREATAAAKERDAAISDQIRTMLYDPEKGYMNQQGGNAVQAREMIIKQLEAMKGPAMEGLNKAAQRKLTDSLNARIDRALNSIDQHASGERQTWLDGARDAQLKAARDDALFDITGTDTHIKEITSLTFSEAISKGLSNDERDGLLLERVSQVYVDQTTLIMAKDPVLAEEYLKQNADKMSKVDVANLTIKLEPEVKRQRGRVAGERAYLGQEGFAGAMKLAAQNLGMNEVEQRETLQAYLANGGAGLDPAKVAWCADYMNATLHQAGIKGTGSNMARSFLEWGQEATDPQKGDIVVLSRGDPRLGQGHVGFFDGYNEDGSIRVLGGNQGDSVSVATYSADRVLGFRRPAEGDVKISSGLSGLLAIKDPLEREAAINEYNLRTSAREGEKTRLLVAGREDAIKDINAGGNPMNWSQERRDAIGETGYLAALNYHDAVNRGVTVKDDPQTYMSLTRQALDPATAADFRNPAKTNLMEYIDKLSPTTWKSFVDMQNAPLKPAEATSVSTMMGEADTVLRTVIDISAGASDDDKATYANVQMKLVEWQRQWMLDNKVAPTELDRQNKIRELVENVVIAPGLVWNGGEALRVDLGGLDLNESDIADSPIIIGEIRYEADIVNEAIGLLKAGNLPVNAETIATVLSLSEKYKNAPDYSGALPQ